KDASMAAQLAASSLSSDNPQFQQWLKDPQRLLEMIAAAQGSSDGSSWVSDGQPGSARGHSQTGTPVSEPNEEEMYRILGVLTRLGNMGGPAGPGAGGGITSVFPQELSELPTCAREVLKQALAELSAKAAALKPDQGVLVQLAEHLAIR